MSVETPLPSASLYYREGSSDKVYQAAVELSGDGYIVNFAFGRRGTTLQTGSKTPSPVSLEKASKIFDKLIAEKTAKGYTPGESGQRYQQTPNADRATGMQCQLLNAIEEPELAPLLSDPEWWMQEKMDGKRMLIRRAGKSVTGINRLGLTVSLPESVVTAAMDFAQTDFLLDGEIVSDIFHAFDLLHWDGDDLRQEQYCRRWDLLASIEQVNGEEETGANENICVVSTAMDRMDKRTMLSLIRGRRGEGVVLKRRGAPHTPGRPSKGGDWLKFKFTQSCTCLVTGHNAGKRSVVLGLIADKNQTCDTGSVTIPPNEPIPAIGSMIEVRYLYAFPGGSLFQPVYQGVRTDIRRSSCTLKQLKFKAADDEQ